MYSPSKHNTTIGSHIMSNNIYNSSNYRSIWESHYGDIPKDDHGVSYEIHHIDGDHTNNHISNLMCISIQEHYDIHYAQQDWAACALISSRLDGASALFGELISKAQKELVAQGKHHFLDKEFHANRISNMSEEMKTMIYTKVRKKTLKRVYDGTHNFMSEDHRNLTSKLGKKRWKEGSSNLIHMNEKRIAAGTHNWTGKDRDSKHNFPVGYVSCVDKMGNRIKITREAYSSQPNIGNDREYVHTSSKEGMRRKKVELNG